MILLLERKFIFELTFKARALGLGGNLKGDRAQNGGALVVEKGGTATLLQYIQKEAPDHVANIDVLKALDLYNEGMDVPSVMNDV